jgi:hypothetical protein
VFVIATLFVIPEGNLLLLLLVIPQRSGGISFFFIVCHSAA